MRRSAKNGMTLVEVIISMAIFGIILVAFLSIFSSGYIGVLSAGKHTEVGYEAQKLIEEATISTGVGSEIITIEFPGDFSLDVVGSKIVKDVDNGKQSIEVTAFVPNP